MLRSCKFHSPLDLRLGRGSLRRGFAQMTISNAERNPKQLPGSETLELLRVHRLPVRRMRRVERHHRRWCRRSSPNVCGRLSGVLPAQPTDDRIRSRHRRIFDQRRSRELSAYSSSREHGPFGSPHAHPPPVAAIVSEEPLADATANTDSFFSRRVPSHFGQCVVSEPRTIASNSFPQLLHTYSKMGMASAPRQRCANIIELDRNH
jgi:hypothetical protein